MFPELKDGYNKMCIRDRCVCVCVCVCVCERERERVKIRGGIFDYNASGPLVHKSFVQK